MTRHGGLVFLAATWIYVIFWVGLAFASVVVGDVFRAFNPWRALASGVARIVPWRREPLAYPEWLGRLPAAIGIFGFAWLELVYPNKVVPQDLGDPRARLRGSAAGRDRRLRDEAWSDRGDAFSVYFGLFARLAPLRWAGGRVFGRPPFVGAADLEVLPRTVALLAVMIGSTSFDGFSVGSVWVGSGQSDVQACSRALACLWRPTRWVTTRARQAQSLDPRRVFPYARTMRRILGLVGVVVVFGATGAATARPARSGIAGKVEAGPVCPVERVPPQPGCAPRPLAAKLIVRQVGHGVPPVTVHSNAAGRFRVSLAPGTYVVHALPPAGSTLPRPPADKRVRVIAGRFATVTILYDTGIR